MTALNLVVNPTTTAIIITLFCGWPRLSVSTTRKTIPASRVRKFSNTWPFLLLNKVRIWIRYRSISCNTAYLYQLGNIREALQLTLELLKIVPYHQRALGNKKYYEDLIRQESVKRRGETGEYVIPTEGLKANDKRYLIFIAETRIRLTLGLLKRSHLLLSSSPSPPITCQSARNMKPCVAAKSSWTPRPRLVFAASTWPTTHVTFCSSLSKWKKPACTRISPFTMISSPTKRLKPSSAWLSLE